MNRFAIASCSIAAAVLGSAAVLTAGPLSPPAGPVSATYKTLSDVEPRIPISQATTPGDADSLFKITQPGSYYLTGNIAGVAGRSGIKIAASDVTIDLAGFEVRGVPGTREGIVTDSTRDRIVIRNGMIVGWSLGGINLNFGSQSHTIEDVIASSNGLTGISTGPLSSVRRCTLELNQFNGLQVGAGSVIDSCNARSNSVHGIVAGTANAGQAVISNCSSTLNTLDGIVMFLGSTASNCTSALNQRNGFAIQGHSNINGCTAYQNGVHGFNTSASVGTGGTLGSSRHRFSDCLSTSNGGNGFELIGGFSTVDHCSAQGNTHGFNIGALTAITNCYAEGNGSQGVGAGIRMSASCMVSGNTLISNAIGIQATSTANTIMSNRITLSSTAFSIPAGNKVAPCVVAPASLAISGSTGGAGVGSTDPSANIVY